MDILQDFNLEIKLVIKSGRQKLQSKKEKRKKIILFHQDLFHFINIF